MARQLRDSLDRKGHLIFLDTENIRPGLDFSEKIKDAVKQADVMLVLIGQEWGRTFMMRAGTSDYVRLEIELALQRNGLRVIPVTVDGARMPLGSELPSELRKLEMADAVSIENSRLEEGLNRLLGLLPFAGALESPYAPEKDLCDLNYFRAIAAPFQRKDWFKSLFWVGLLALVPFLDLVAFRGWRLDVTRRVAMGADSPFPRAGDFASFVRTGFLVWLYTFLYLLPGRALMIGYVVFREFAAVNRVIQGVKAIFHGQFDLIWTALAELARALVSSGLFIVLLFLVYILVQGLLRRVATIRFALTGRASAFFGVGTNFRILGRHLKRFLIVDLLENLNFYLVCMPILAALGAEIVGVSLAFTIHYWVSGYLYGQAGKCVVSELHALNKATLPKPA